MHVAVITPVGPGHELAAGKCMASVRVAWARSRGPFGTLTHAPVFDSKGSLGRSAARNRGVCVSDRADWYLFLDADDRLEPDAFALVAPHVAPPSFEDSLDSSTAPCTAVFGAVQTERHGIVRENRHPVTWADLMEHGPVGTLSMGCFVRGDVARATPFNESLDRGEDFDFYLRALHGRPFVKLPEPLVMIGDTVPSAGGPRGYGRIDWRAECQAVIDRWKAEAA